MQIQAISSFLVVYEMQNLSRASEKLFVTQQCLSSQIRGLEKELGVQLFTRNKSGIQPTDICRRIQPVMQDMMSDYEKAKQICFSQEQYRLPQLTVVFAGGLSNYIDVNTLSALVHEYSGAELVLEEHPAKDCLALLRHGKADLAFVLEPFDDTTLEHTLIREDYGCIAMLKTNPLASEPGPIPFSALDGVKTVTNTSSNCAAEHLQHYCNGSNVHPQYVAYMANLVGYVNSLDRSDVVVTLLSCELVNIKNPDIVVRKVVDPVLMGKCHCCYRSESPIAPLLKELMLKVKNNFFEVPSSALADIRPGEPGT